MTEHDSKLHIKLCMGSCCFARGNSRALTIIREFLHDHQLTDQVEISGLLCQENCNLGPNITINDQHYHHVDPTTVIDLINFHLNQNLHNQ